MLLLLLLVLVVKVEQMKFVRGDGAMSVGCRRINEKNQKHLKHRVLPSFGLNKRPLANVE